MRYLLDTHTLIWAVQATSFWEIALKTSINKFSFDNLDINEFPELSRKMGFKIIELGEQASITFHNLPKKENHKDPFDRMLIWQAIVNNFVLISKDNLMKQYKENGLDLVW